MARDSGRVSTLRYRYQDDLEALTWSELVAIGIAIKDHKICSKMSEYLSIMHWLATAKKRKIFSESTVSELQWLIDGGKKKSFSVQFGFKIGCLYVTSSGDATVQDDYSKFTHTIEVLRNNGWENFLLTPKKWQDLYESIKTRKGGFIFIDDARFQEYFGVQGEVVKPFCIRVYSDIEFAKSTFIKHNLPVEFVKRISNEFYYFNFLSGK